MLEKLLKIQKELKAPKNQRNSFGGYNYRSCEDIFEAVKPLLDISGLVLVMSDAMEQIGDRYYIKATATLYDVETSETMSNTAYAREEETKKGMDGSQITGASSSYARKYALNGLFLIDDVKDSDTTNTGVEVTEEDAKNYVFSFGKHSGKKLTDVINEDYQYIKWLLNSEKTDKEILKCIELLTGEVPLTKKEQDEIIHKMNVVSELLESTNTDREKFYKHYGVKSNGEMTLEQLDDAIKKLMKKV
jgi:Trp operon repressor